MFRPGEKRCAFLTLSASTFVGTLLLDEDGLRERGRGRGQSMQSSDEPARVDEVMVVVHVVLVE